MSVRSVDEVLEGLNLDRCLTVPQSVTIPDRPDSLIPAMVHRNSDGWVSFSRKVAAGFGEEKWEPLGNYPASDITGLFRDQFFQDEVDEDAYFSLNTFCKSDRVKPVLSQLDMMAPPLRKVSALRHLTCCWVDMDGYKCGLDKHDLYASVMRRAERGEVPVPSFFTVSRGVWAVWLLKDRRDPEEPVRDFPHAKVYGLWQRLQRCLHERLADVGSDKGSQDGARVTRIPGTINRKGGQRVGYMVPLGPDQKPFSYTLEELDYFLRPPENTKRLRFKGSGPTDDDTRSDKRRGWRSRYVWLVQRLGWLRMARRGWSVGHRDLAMLYLAIGLKGTGWSMEKVEATFREHLDDMEQPAHHRVTMRHCLEKYHRADFKEGGVSNQTVADGLCVTTAEAAELTRKQNREPFPSASQFPAVQRVTRADKQQARRDAMLRLWDLAQQHGQKLGGTSMRERLLAQGIPGSLRTVLKDMRKLGLIPDAEPVADRQRRLELVAE